MSASTPAIRSHSRLSREELFLIFGFWTFVALLSSVSRMIDPRGPGLRGLGNGAPVVMAFIESWLWAAFTPLIFWMSSRFSASGATVGRVLLLVVIGILVSITVYLLLAHVREELFEVVRRRRVGRMRELSRFWFIPQFLYFVAILATGFAREYFLRDRDRQAHAVKLEAQLAGARLDALRMQINPHFLFNTLHAISALVERDPSGVRKMIARLSELLRHTTDARAADEVTLGEELDFLRRYIEIMEIRFQGRLRVERELDPALDSALVPNLILQPIVENALEHGASRAIGEGRIVIRSRREGERIILSVSDNGPGVTAEARKGVGLANTRARLQQLYGDAASVQLETAADGGALAEVVIPYHTEPLGATVSNRRRNGLGESDIAGGDRDV